jgi:hypothetical protein
MTGLASRSSTRSSVAACIIAGVAFTLLPRSPAAAQGQPPDQQCRVDLSRPGEMRDIVSNALRRGLTLPQPDITEFLEGAGERYATGQDLLQAAAAHFNLSEDALAAEVLKFKHTNCRHEGGGEARPPDDGLPIPAFARDVTLHVVLHELGHALIREFDIPILGNEETAADAFATYYLTTCLPDRAVDVLAARTRSLMIEAAETPDVDWTGEHDDDARRAYQIAALAVAADPVKYKPIADIVGMSTDDISDAADSGAEIRRSWRRVLAPLWMPGGEQGVGAASAEARLRHDADTPFLDRLCSDGLASEIEDAIGRFDWHSQVTIEFVDGSGGAGWSRSSRTVTVHSEYVRRFIEQGTRAAALTPTPADSN